MAALRQQLDATSRNLCATRRQVWGTWALASVGCGFAFVLGLSPEARAQVGITLASLNTRLTAAEGSIATLQTKTASMSAITDTNTNQPTVRFTGVNVQIVNGVGSTIDDTIIGTNRANGRGNLIIGYNKLRGVGDTRTGSHFLIVGDRQNYSTGGGIVAGDYNTVSNYFSSVTGGIFNVVSGDRASVSGGTSNTASNTNSSVSGGINNTASGGHSSVSGGYLNTASGSESSISGGYQNTASGNYSSVSGGYQNNASGQLSYLP